MLFFLHLYDKLPLPFFLSNAMQTLQNELIAKFSAHFGREPEIVSYAPGRIEVLGNHTDYNEGYVLSAAINYGTFFAVSKRADNKVHLLAGDLMEEVSFDVRQPIAEKESMWANYVKGCIAGLSSVKAPQFGFDAAFLGNIPLGSGLSSSAALETCATLAIARLFDITLPKLEIAKIGQKAEHTFAGVKCGLLDQVSSIYGEENALVLSDFRSFDIKPIAFPEDVCFLMCNTHAKHALVDGAYNERRESCEIAARFFATVLDHPVSALRDVSWNEWLRFRDSMDDRIARRAAHPIGEDTRVLEGIDCLRSGDAASFGKLMFDSHESSRVYFENSCPELDTVVNAAKSIPGILGARLSGGGFGGSAVVLVNKRDAETAAEAIRNAYAHQYGSPCDTRIISCSQGAHLVKA